MNESILDGFHAVNIDTKSWNSGSHYVPCPSCSADRKKKNAKCLLINFSTGWYQCFHGGCDFKGFAQNGARKGEQAKYVPPPKLAQQFIPELDKDDLWIFPDTTISPKPENPGKPTSPSDITWYFRDIHGKLTGAKRMSYTFEGDQMKRVKEKPPLHLFSRDAGYYPCLFNEYDLATHPQATVILVESEKTAALLKYKFKAQSHEFIYIATGGTNGLTDEKAQVLKGRNVWISYDCDNAGREGAESALKKLQPICNARTIDISPKNEKGEFTLNDGTDLGDLTKTLTIQEIRDYGKLVPENVLIAWEQRMVKEKPKEIPPLVTIHGTPTLRLRNISLVIGKKKSRKTLFLVWLICEAIKQGVPAEEIVFFDTEQDEYDVWQVKDRVFRLSGQIITVFAIGDLNYKLRKELIHWTIQYWHKPIKLCFIDGIRDLMRDINDISETTDIIDWLLMMKATFQTHIMLVLHMNKTDDKARGHIGTELQNKCEITIELERDPKAECTMVKVESSRKRPFEPFAFTHSTDDLPLIVDAPIAGNTMPADERKKRLMAVFQDGPLKYGELIQELCAEFAVSASKSRVLVKDFLRLKWIRKNGKDRDPNTTYGLITGEDLPYAPPVKEEPEQLTIEAQNNSLPEECPFL